MIKQEEQQRRLLEKTFDPAEYEAKLIQQQKDEPKSFEDAFWKLIEKI